MDILDNQPILAARSCAIASLAIAPVMPTPDTRRIAEPAGHRQTG
jgi:hypothetical protein